MENSRSSSDIGVISDSGVNCPFYQKVKKDIQEVKDGT